MRPEPILTVAAQAAAQAELLNARSRGMAPAEVLAAALADPGVGRIAMVSSFGAESVVLLHMVAQIDRTLPVIFLDTQLMFAETYDYQREVAERLGLADLRIVRPEPAALAVADADGKLHRRDADACCHLRKTLPLERALADFDGWITGRKRFQGATRVTLDHFEAEATGRLKINPLAHLGRQEIAAYMAEHDLPPHPLVARGFTSIGCAPCTTRTLPGEDPRAGRWRGSDKNECGVHFLGRGVVRTGEADEEEEAA